MFSKNEEESNPAQDQKIYGCAVMGMELGNTGVVEWVNPDPKWVKFNSEVAIRKGDEGWVINSRVDNWSSDTSASFEYLLVTYKYSNNKWEKDGNPKLWSDPISFGGESYLKTQSNSKNETVNQLNVYDKKLVIKVPGDSWFNSDDLIYPNSGSKTKTKVPIETKSWSGVWIEDTNKKENSWIFGDIELYVGEQKYSQVFCKGENNDCFQLSELSKGMTTKRPSESDTWSNLFTNGNNSSEKIEDVVKNTVKGIIEKLKDSKGSWAKLEDICEAKLDGTPDEERQKQLRMYCSKGKKSK